MRPKILTLATLGGVLALVPAASRGASAPSAPITYDVFRQGSDGTCWVIASMAALQFSGADLSKQVRRKGENLYEVTLYRSNEPGPGGMHAEVCEVRYDGGTHGGDLRINPDRGAAWALVMHRGFILAARRWHSGEPTGGGRPSDALSILTGSIAANLPVKAGCFREKIRKRIEAALQARRPVVFCMRFHAYAVLKSSPEEVTLYNPWGLIEHVSWKDVIGHGREFCIGEIHAREGGATTLPTVVVPTIEELLCEKMHQVEAELRDFFEEFLRRVKVWVVPHHPPTAE
jgi:hypothetical protein